MTIRSLIERHTHRPGWFYRARVKWAKKNLSDFMVFDKDGLKLCFADNGNITCRHAWGRHDEEMGFARSFVRWWELSVDCGYELSYVRKNGESVNAMEERQDAKWRKRELDNGFCPDTGENIGKHGSERRNVWEVERVRPGAVTGKGDAGADATAK